MEIITKFNLGDTAYSIKHASEGNLIPLIIEKINITVETSEIIIIEYQVSSTNLFHNTIFGEDQLGTCDEVVSLAQDEIQTQIDQLQTKLDNTSC